MSDYAQCCNFAALRAAGHMSDLTDPMSTRELLNFDDMPRFQNRCSHYYPEQADY